MSRVKTQVAIKQSFNGMNLGKKARSMGQAKVTTIPSDFAVKNYHELIKDYFPNIKFSGTNDKSIHYQTVNVVMERIETENDTINKIPKDIPGSLTKLINMVRGKYRIPNSCGIIATMAYAARLSNTELKPPDRLTAKRMLINYNNNEMYRLKSAVSSVDEITNQQTQEIQINNGIQTMDQYLESNTIMEMGPSKLCQYDINTNQGKWIYIKNPDGSSRKTLKPNSYARLTIIIDVHISEEYSRLLIRDVKRLNMGLKVNQILKTVIEEMIRDFDEVKMELQSKVKPKNTKEINDLINKLE